MDSPTPKRPKYFFAYTTATAELHISTRTLRRWIEYLGLEPLELESGDQVRVFLSLPHMEILREYSKVLATHDTNMIADYRQAVYHGNDEMVLRIRKRISRG